MNHKMNLLIVNDEVIAAKGLMMGINWNEYGIGQVDVAFEAQSAREMLSNEKYDIILCDIEMPGDSGIDLVRWVRAEKLDIEVIFLTCHADFEFAQEAIRLQCKNYILVPASYESVAESVYDVVLAIQKRQEERRQQQYGQMWMGAQEKKLERHPQLWKSVEEYVEKHLDDPHLGSGMIAAQMYMNVDYLNRVFKREKGMSIGSYILGKRMKLAGDMLVEGKFGASQIAEMVGYNTYSAFVKAFKNCYGCPPSRYPEAVKK